jgi:hypothetical protein
LKNSKKITVLKSLSGKFEVYVKFNVEVEKQANLMVDQQI